MPIDLIDPAEILGGRIARTGPAPEPAPGSEPATSPRPSTGEGLEADARTGLFYAISSQVGKPDFPETPGFNPYKFIDERYNQPGAFTNSQRQVLDALVERDQFAYSNSEEEFWHDFRVGEQLLNDLDTAQRAPTYGLATFRNIFGDPSVVLPGALAAKLPTIAALNATKGLSTAARIFTAAGIVATAATGRKLTQDALLPALNEPGAADELLTFAMAAGLGAGIGTIAAPSLAEKITQGLADAKISIARERTHSLLAEKVFAFGDGQVDPVLGLGSDGNAFVQAGLSGAEARAVRSGTMADVWKSSQDELAAALKEAPNRDRFIRVIWEPGDANAALVGELRAKYKAAGLPDPVVELDGNDLYRKLKFAERELSRPSLNAAATNAELGQGIVSKIAGGMGSGWAKATESLTPGGRLSKSVMARIDDVARGMFGSVQTVTKGGAASPLTFESGSTAEGIKNALYATRNRAIELGLRKTYNELAKDGVPITYEGRTIQPKREYGRFSEAVGLHMRKLDDQARGYITDIGEVHPAIQKAVTQTREYLNDWADRLDEVGLFPGKRALAAKTAEVESLKLVGDNEAKIATAETELEDLQRYAEASKFYSPVVFIPHKILKDPEGFKAAVKEGLRRVDRTYQGAYRSNDDTPIRIEVAKSLDHDQIKVIEAITRTEQGTDKIKPVAFEQAAKHVTEGMLPTATREKYRARLAEFYEKEARQVYETITGAEVDGVADAISSSNPLRARTLSIPKALLADYLDNDMERVIARYHSRVAGRYAVARAIQTNPTLANATLLDGTKVTDGETLEKYLLEGVRTIREVQAVAEKGVVSESDSLLPAFDRITRTVEHDILNPLRVLEGRYRMGSFGDDGMWSFIGRTIGRSQFLSKMGSVVINQINDTAPIIVRAMMNPAQFRQLAETVGGLRGLNKADLEHLGLWTDGMTRSHATADLDDYLNREGFGSGRTRRVSAAVERGTSTLSNFSAKATGLDWFNNNAKRLNGHMVAMDVTQKAKRFAKAMDLLEGGVEEKAALRKAGLSAYESARMNRIGLTGKRARQFNEQAYKHGLLADDTPVSSKMTFEEYLNSKQFVKPNFSEGDASAKGLLDTISGNINTEVTRHLVVTPGVLDKPVFHYQKPIARLLNTFQTFSMAFANQRLRPMAQMPFHQTGGYLMAYMFLGAISDAISNDLSGRRSFEDTAKLWQENPGGMVYAAWGKSGLAGWIQRPLALGDMLGIGISPGVLFDNTVGSSAARHVQKDRILQALGGPVATDIQGAALTFGDLGSFDTDKWTAYNGWKLAWFQNYIGLRLLNRLTGAPVVPESLVRDIQKNREPKP